MIEIYLLITAFVIKHFVADFVLQYDYMVKQKGQWMQPGGLHHVGIHAAGTLFILLPFGVGLITMLMAAIIDAVTHYVIDWTKQQANKGLPMTSRKFWLLIGLDQMMHYLVYILLTWMILK